MVGVAQLVEPWIVIPVVVGSSPIIHPNTKEIGPLAQLVEQWTLNPLVEGSNPSWPTNKIKGLQRFFGVSLFLLREFCGT